MTPVFQTGGAGSTPAGCLKIGKLSTGEENRGQACHQGRNAASSPTLNNQLSVGLEVIGRVRDNSPLPARHQNKYGSMKPRPLSIADFRLLRTHVVLYTPTSSSFVSGHDRLVHASVARGIMGIGVGNYFNILEC